MADTIQFILDGKEITAQKGQTILQAADNAGIYIPRLCNKNGISPFGSCRVCTVLINGRPQAACTQPAAPGVVVENNTEKLLTIRKHLIEMLFVEGNHFCMFCEKSGNCELQALAYRFGIDTPRLPYFFPKREMDASHPKLMIERNRCILCGRCVRTSQEIDKKNVFGFTGRSIHKKIQVNSCEDLAHTNAADKDQAMDACPVGAILHKETGYRIPIGKRQYDEKPIGSDIEKKD